MTGEHPRSLNSAAEDMFVFEAADLKSVFGDLGRHAIESTTETLQIHDIEPPVSRLKGYISASLPGFEDWASYID